MIIIDTPIRHDDSKDVAYRSSKKFEYTKRSTNSANFTPKSDEMVTSAPEKTLDYSSLTKTQAEENSTLSDVRKGRSDVF